MNPTRTEALELAKPTAWSTRILQPEKGRLYVWLIIPGVVFLDIANGILGEGTRLPGVGLTPGELGRALVYVAALITLIKYRGPMINGLRWSWIGLLALGLLGPLWGLTRGASAGSVLVDLERLSKLLYGPALVLLLVLICWKHRLDTRDVFNAICGFAVVVGLGLTLFRFMGIGEATYGEYSRAFKGFFLAQNDLGLASAIALAAVSHMAFTTRKLRYGLVALIAITAMLLLGTRTATLAALIVPVAVFAGLGFKPRSLNQLLTVSVIAVLLLGAVLAVGFQRYQAISAEGYQRARFAKLLEGDITRTYLAAGGLLHVAQRPVEANIIGEGTSRYERGVARQLGLSEERRIAEIDWLDVLGAHGILLMLALYAFYLRFLFSCFGRSGQAIGPARWTMGLMLAIYLLHGTLAGHALANPLPSGVITPALALIWILAVRPAGTATASRGRE